MNNFFCYLAAMAIVTYLIRMIPFTAVRGKIKSRFVKSFLYYVPYGVLSAMTFPYIFYSTGNTITSVLGTVAAFLLAFINRPLIEVAAFSSLIAYVAGVVF